MNIITNANSAALDSNPYQERMWTPKRLAAVLAAVCVLVICWQVADVRLGTLFQRTTFDALRTLLRGLFPPDLSIQFLRTVFHAIVTTLATAIVGTVLSVLIAIPFGALGTTSLQQGGILGAAENGNLITILRSWVGRAVIALLGFLRAIPDLVWGLLFVTAVGLGSLAGTLALTVSYVGVLGRVYAHAFGDVDLRPLEALQATGATRTQIFLRGIWPQSLPNLTAYTLYSFECCVRAASVLGFVGAGGIGYEISLSMHLFEYGQVMTLVLAFILLLALTDYASRWLRVRLQPDAGSVQTHRQFDGLSNGRYNSLVRPALGYLVLTVVTVASFYLAGFSLEHFGEANIIRNIFRFCRGMFPPDFTKQFVLSLGPLLIQTLAISILGTLLGIVIGGILAIPATSTLVAVRADAPGAESHIERVIRSGVFWTARLLLNLLRSIPDLVWVLICIIVVGIGPFAGTLAIGIHTGGVLGKLYAETLEEVPPQPVEALRALGAGPVQLFLWVLWPQARRMLTSYTVLRWETNLRVSAILGLMGGGGIGQAIYNNVQLGFYSRLATLLMVIYALVIACDWIADKASRTTVGV